MKNLKVKISTLSLTLSTLPFIGIANAQEAVKPYITDIRGIYNLVARLAKWFQAFFFIIAAIFIIMAAFSYLTSAGNEDKVRTAKTQLIYAVVATVVALLAFAIVTISKNFVGPGTTVPLYY